MQNVQLGKTDLSITPLAFGAWAIGGWMWGGADKADAIEALEVSIERGMTSIDTAPVYGFGQSEEIVGEVIRGKRDRVEILTKYGMTWESEQGKFYFDSLDNRGKPVKIYKYASKDQVIKECEDSLRRLRTDYIDLYQIHWPDPTTPVEETMEAVDQLIRQGKIRAAGVCNYDVPLSKSAHDSLLLASNQVPYSMVRRDIEEELVPWCIDHSVSILAYSPLQRGLLTGKIKPGYEFASGDNRPDTPYFQPENIERVNRFLDQLRPIAEEKSASLAQVVIRWTLAQPGITVALVGARNRKQVEENIGAMDFELEYADVKKINEFLSELKLAGI
jgi:aryl-alcohol dehydrogenase-like predicted oxidoreductase